MFARFLYVAFCFYLTHSGLADSLPEVDDQLHFPKDKRAALRISEENSLGSYRKIGSRNPKWDKHAEEALLIWSRWVCVDDVVSGTTNFTKMVNNFRTAIEAGCDDPLIKYAALGLRRRGITIDSRPPGDIYKEIIGGLKDHAYPPSRQVWIYMRAADHFWSDPEADRADKALSNTWLTNAVEQLALSIDGYPDREDLYELASHIEGYFLIMPDERKAMFDLLKPRMDRSVRNKVVPLVFEGRFYTAWAWDARGYGYANSVTDEGWKLFRERLDKARDALKRAWKLDPTDPYIYVTMVRVEGSGGSSGELNKWYERGRKAAPSNRLYTTMLNFLQPKWGGSKEKIMEVGMQCRASGDWINQTPFILLDAYRLSDNGAPNFYVRNPQAWKDAQSLFEEYLKRYPKNNVKRSAYCYAAYRANDMKLAFKLYNELGDLIVPQAFNGEFENAKQTILWHGGSQQSPKK